MNRMCKRVTWFEFFQLKKKIGILKGIFDCQRPVIKKKSDIFDVLVRLI